MKVIKTIEMVEPRVPLAEIVKGDILEMRDGSLELVIGVTSHIYTLKRNLLNNTLLIDRIIYRKSDAYNKVWEKYRITSFIKENSEYNELDKQLESTGL